MENLSKEKQNGIITEKKLAEKVKKTEKGKKTAKAKNAEKAVKAEKMQKVEMENVKKTGKAKEIENEEILLAINTAFSVASLALEVGEARYFREVDSCGKHSEKVLPAIDQLCREAKIDIMQVQVLAVVVGPGSFTGLRIGTAIAKALGCANQNLKFLALSSLQLMAYKAVKEHKLTSDFACALDALSHLAFVQEFDRNGREKIAETGRIGKIGETEKAEKTEKAGKFGKTSSDENENGKENFGAKLVNVEEVKNLKERVFSLDLDEAERIELNACDLLGFAKQCLDEKKFVPLQEMVPKYIRKSQAEDNLLSKKKNN